MRPEVNSNRFEISLRDKISLRSEVTSLSAFTWLREQLNSLQYTENVRSCWRSSNFLKAARSLDLIKCFKISSLGLKFLEIWLFFSISILPLRLWLNNHKVKGQVVAILAGFYTIRVLTEKRFRTDYNFDYNYNLCNGVVLKSGQITEEVN